MQHSQHCLLFLSYCFHCKKMYEKTQIFRMEETNNANLHENMFDVLYCHFSVIWRVCIIQLMSTEKLKIFKKIKGIDSYSKNPIIDSLIKQKLQSEMIVIKDNFNQLVRKEHKQPDSQPKPTLRRRLSTHNLAAITPQKIQNSLAFHPVEKFTIDFVNQRQRTSPLIEQSAVEELNKARNNGQDLFVKLKQSDKIVYQSAPIQDASNYYSQLQARLRKTLSSDLWLPEKPEVQQIVTSRASYEESSSRKPKSQMFHLGSSRRQLSQGFSPLKSSRELKLQKGNRLPTLADINYETKKYHKNDYISLQKWLEQSLNSLQNGQKSQEQEEKLKQRLNKIYTIYMCAIKELIRLTYIESAEKGLLIQKLIWSLVRLFQSLIKEQHAINYREFKTISKQVAEERQLFRDRMQKLEKELKVKQENYAKISEERSHLVFTALTFKKVNEEMNTEINSLFQELNKVKKQNDFLMNNLIKIIKQFEEREIIKVLKTQNCTSYYYLNSKDKMEVVAKVDKADELDQHFIKEHQKVQEENAKVSPLDKLENALTNYWGKKRAYLDVDNIIKQHFYADVADDSTQADGRGPYQYIDIATQHPIQGQESFQQFLRKQLIQERESWTKKEEEYKQSQISLKELYEQLRETITNLSAQNIKLKTTIDQKEHEFHIHQRKSMQLQQKISQLQKKIVGLENDLAEMNKKQIGYKAEIEGWIAQCGEMKKRYMFQVENNKILANSNFGLTQKAEDFHKQFLELEDKIKIIAPQLQEAMHLGESSKNPTLLTLTTLVEKHLSKYVERDAKVFLTF